MEHSLSSLIERLEKASGPDREIDALIFVAVDARDPALRVARSTPLGWYVEAGDDEDRPLLQPEYTKSLDAALALCERALPDWDIDLGKVGGEWFATVLPQDGTDIDGEQAPSPALALCLALLRALSQKESKE